ncbi:MAG TPA: sarcosine oxidase subunit gamma family protein [Steroidobacteraceae bacterium]
MPEAPLEDAATVTLLSGLGRLSLRGRPEALTAAGVAFNLKLPDQVCRAAEGDARAALWLGPDEQLLLVQQEVWPEVLAGLVSGLAGTPHSLVDISQRQVALHIGGARAADLLNAGCPLDLHLQAFPVGMCTRTVLAKAPIVLWRTAAEEFHLEVWRSLALYVRRLLGEVAREFEH